MAANFPTSLDALTNPLSTDPLNNPSHSTQHTNENDIVEAIEAKVGIDSSAVASSLDYLVKNTASSNPGHKHTLADGATDLTKASTAEVTTGTDDTKYVSAKGIRDATHTFTSPVINTGISGTAIDTSTDLDGSSASNTKV